MTQVLVVGIFSIKGMSNLFPGMTDFVDQLQKEIFFFTCPLAIIVVWVELSATKVVT